MKNTKCSRRHSVLFPGGLHLRSQSSVDPLIKCPQAALIRQATREASILLRFHVAASLLSISRPRDSSWLIRCILCGRCYFKLRHCMSTCKKRKKSHLTFFFFDISILFCINTRRTPSKSRQWPVTAKLQGNKATEAESREMREKQVTQNLGRPRPASLLPQGFWAWVITLPPREVTWVSDAALAYLGCRRPWIPKTWCVACRASFFFSFFKIF